MPTRQGFLDFIRDAMQIDDQYLDDSSIYIDMSFDLAVELVYLPLSNISPLLYTMAVYNLAASNLIEMTLDQNGETFFTDLRKSLNLDSFSIGIVQSASDESTSTGLELPDFVKNLTLADTQYLKTPWGRQYLQIAQRLGTLWGLS